MACLALGCNDVVCVRFPTSHGISSGVHTTESHLMSPLRADETGVVLHGCESVRNAGQPVALTSADGLLPADGLAHRCMRLVMVRSD